MKINAHNFTYIKLTHEQKMNKIIIFLNNNLMDKKFFFKNSIIGLIAGIISGLFASGGGLILVPAFSFLNKLEEKKSRATSIFCILPLVITSGIIYFTGDYIDWNIGIKCAIGGIIGGIIGSHLLKKLDERILKITFIIFLIYVSYKMF